MWSYKRQIIIRYLSFIAGIALVAVYLTEWAQLQPGFFTKIGLKNTITGLAVTAELSPVKNLLIFVFSTVFLMLAGVPSIIFFTLALPIKGFYAAFVLTLCCQVIVSMLAIRFAGRNGRKPKIAGNLENKFSELSGQFKSFAFWSRVYYAFPLRTIDALTPALQPQNGTVLRIFPAISTAIAIRMLIPAFWIDSLVNFATSLDHNPAGDIGSLLLWSSALVVYTIIPRAPELFICPEKVKQALFMVEEPDLKIAAKTQSAVPGSQVKVPPPRVSSAAVVTSKPQLVK